MQSGTPATAGRCRWCRVAAAGAGPAGGFPVAARRPAMRAEGWYPARRAGRREAGGRLLGLARVRDGGDGDKNKVVAAEASIKTPHASPSLSRGGARTEQLDWLSHSLFYRPSNWIVLARLEGANMVSKWSRPRPRDDFGRPLPPPVCSPVGSVSMLSAPCPPRHLPYSFLGKGHRSSARPLCLAGAPRA